MRRRVGDCPGCILVRNITGLFREHGRVWTRAPQRGRVRVRVGVGGVGWNGGGELVPQLEDTTLPTPFQIHSLCRAAAVVASLAAMLLQHPGRMGGQPLLVLLYELVLFCLLLLGLIHEQRHLHEDQLTDSLRPEIICNLFLVNQATATTYQRMVVEEGRCPTTPFFCT